MKKLLLSNGLTEYSQAGKDIARQKVELVRCHVAASRDRCAKTLPGKSQPCDNTKVNKNGSNLDIRAR